MTEAKIYDVVKEALRFVEIANAARERIKKDPMSIFWLP